MFKINDYVVYKRDVCLIKDIIKDTNYNIDYYSLVPIEDNTLVIKVPTDNRFMAIRAIISKKEVEEIINKIPEIEIISITNDKLIEQEYKKLLLTGNHLDLIKIIKTTYLRNQDRLDNNKKIGEKDNNYFNIAEKLLYNEFAIVLNMSYNETKDYVKNIVEKVKEKS